VIYSHKLKKTNGFIQMVQVKFALHLLLVSIRQEESLEIWKSKLLNSPQEMSMHFKSSMINMLYQKNV